MGSGGLSPAIYRWVEPFNPSSPGRDERKSSHPVAQPRTPPRTWSATDPKNPQPVRRRSQHVQSLNPQPEPTPRQPAAVFFRPSRGSVGVGARDPSVETLGYSRAVPHGTAAAPPPRALPNSGPRVPGSVPPHAVPKSNGASCDGLTGPAADSQQPVFNIFNPVAPHRTPKSRQGRPRIAQRFIAGSSRLTPRVPGGTKENH